MNKTNTGFVVLVLFLLTTSIAVAANPTDKELRVLKHYEGTWSCEFTILSQESDTKSDKKPQKYTGVVQGKWVLGNRFLEQTGRYQLDANSEPFAIKTMMTYDRQNKRYQFDYFNSSGAVHRSYGKWNEKTKTMTSTMKDDKNGNTVTITADFSKSNVERWTIETKNKDGKIVGRIVGTNTRKLK